jgi:hypothetical protein
MNSSDHIPIEFTLDLSSIGDVFKDNADDLIIKRIKGNEKKGKLFVRKRNQEWANKKRIFIIGSDLVR